METNELKAGSTDAAVCGPTVYEEIDCPGDCNMGRPCLICGSTGQYIGRVSVRTPKVCGMCADFGPQGCTTSVHERKHGHANTPACEEFKPKVGAC